MSFGVPVRNGLGLGLRPSTALSTLGVGGRPALLLNFISTTALPSTVTFSRTTQATLTDSTGRLTYAPNNLATNSESFEAASWAKTGTTAAANTAVAPDGTSTADTATAAAGASQHFFTGNSAGAQNSSLVGSIYFKAGTHNFVQLFFGGSATPFANFNLALGTSSAFGAGTTANIVAVGNGWYRCSVFSNILSLSSLQFALVTSLSAARAESWTAAGTETVLVWGAQLEAITYQTTPGTYNSTTPKNLLGFTQEFDNAAWTKSNSFVQTNLLVQSQFVSGWSFNANTSFNATPVMAPDGTSTARVLNDTSAATNGYVFQSVSMTSGVTYTMSVYVKKGISNFFAITSFTQSGRAVFNLNTNTLDSISGIVSSATITDAGSGWYRCTATMTATATASNNVGYGDFEIAPTGDLMSLWGAQLVQGATAGDYQPTAAAAAPVQYVAPDGTLSAEKLVENTAASTTHTLIFSPVSKPAAATPYAFSIYVKAAERSAVQMRIADSGTSANRVLCDVNLSTQAVTSSAGGTFTNASATVTPAGDGWFRVALTGTTSTETGLACTVFLANPSGTISYTGDGTSGILVWGAQLSNSASLDPYVYNPAAAPTSAAFFGPRFDFDPVTLAPRGLLIEEQRTNLLLRSAEFNDAAWNKSGATVTANSTAAPDGTTTADALVEDATTGLHLTQQSFAFVSGVPYTVSVYVKAGTRTWAQMLLPSAAFTASQGGFFDLTGAGALGTTNGTPTARTITALADGWYRISVTATATTSASGNVAIVAASANGTTSYAGSNGSTAVSLWGAQLEAGAFATSYIPTVASQVTRTADVASMLGANFSSWYNQTQGTLVVNVSATAGNARAATFSAGAVTNQLWVQGGAVGEASLQVFTAGSFVAQIGLLPANSTKKIAAAYMTNDFAVSIDGGAASTDTSGALGTFDRLNLGARFDGTAGFLNGHVRSITYYPTRLTNAQLQAITA